MIIVGITGKAGAGKDTVADRLVNRHGFKKMSFAAPLKEVLLKMNPIIGMDIMQPSRTITLSEALERNGGEDGVKSLFPEYRKLLQKLGTEGIRSIDEQFWIKAATKMILAEPNEARLVFTDCRFPNEAKVIQEAGLWGNYVLPLPDPTTELWYVHRPVVQAREGETVVAHSSEEHAGNMNEEFFVPNGGSITELYDVVDDLARDLIDVEGVKLAGG